MSWRALEAMARDQMKSFQELADEAFAALLEKHERPVDFKDAVRRSARMNGERVLSSGTKKKRVKKKAA